VTKNTNGTWAWSFTPSQGYSSETVFITGTDEDGGSSQIQFTFDALVAVVNSRVYYKGSSFSDSGVSSALDPSKSVIKSAATPQELSFANLINTTRGINGLVFDVAGLAAASLTNSDFVLRMSPTGNFSEAANPPSGWQSAPAPTLIDVTAGTTTTPSRVRLEWADNAIANRWLQIKILANSNTGLTNPQDFYFGHLLGETTGSVEGTAFRVRGTDVAPLVALINPGVSVPVDDIYDLNKDGRVRGSDSSASYPALGRLLTRITIPPAGSSEEGESRSASTACGGYWAGEAVDDSSWKIRARLTDAVFHLPMPLTSSLDG
jgi:hypothetical protein